MDEQKYVQQLRNNRNLRNRAGRLILNYQHGSFTFIKLSRQTYQSCDRIVFRTIANYLFRGIISISIKTKFNELFLFVTFYVTFYAKNYYCVGHMFIIILQEYLRS